MEFKQVDLSRVPKKTYGGTKILLPKTGGISFSPEAELTMELKQGDEISLIEGGHGKFYLKKEKTGKGILLEKYKKAQALRIGVHSKMIRNHLCNVMKLDIDQNHRIDIGEKEEWAAEFYWPLLIAQKQPTKADIYD